MKLISLVAQLLSLNKHAKRPRFNLTDHINSVKYSYIDRRNQFQLWILVVAFCSRLCKKKINNAFNAEQSARELRQLLRTKAGLVADVPDEPNIEDLLAEFRFLHASSRVLRPAFLAIAARRTLFCGQAYYNAWYLSRTLRQIGWKADVYNWDANPASQIYYHGEDFKLGKNIEESLVGELKLYLNSLYEYDIIHFSNMHGISYGPTIEPALEKQFGSHANIHLLKALGKKILYSNNGCMDGVSQTSFSKWGPESVCSICRWQQEPTVCSDSRNLAWGKFRNEVADYQCTLGGNRADFNDDPRVHEVPEFYCLDKEIWSPNISIPQNYRLPNSDKGAVRLYHAVGNRVERTRSDGKNIKTTHIYLPLIEKLRAEGLNIELIEAHNMPNIEVRYIQIQADIVLDMLTFGWFGANVREAMMLGKPVICFLRPEWLKSMRDEIPDYVDELPVISATPHNIEEILRGLILDKKKREAIGQKSREFALKWHSSQVAARRFNEIYTGLLAGESLLRKS